MVHRWLSLIEAASDPIISVDSRQRIVLFNRAAQETFGWAEDEVLGRPLSMLLPVGMREAHAAKVAGFAQEESGWRRMADTRPTLAGSRKDGTQFPAEVTISKVLVEGDWHFTAIVRDVSERDSLRAELARLSHYDALTGLPNRRLLAEAMTTSLQALEPDGALAVLFVDIDRFKRINDALGHVAGDSLLTQFGARLRASTRKRDTVARFGGDEFVILAHCDSGGDSAGIAARLMGSWSDPFVIGGQAITVTASAGISIARSRDTAHDGLLRDADIALFRAKDLGRNRIEVFDPVSGGWAANRLDLEQGLEHAAKRGEFEVHYQPVVRLRDGSITGFEALLRWQHAGRMISPCEFIPIAEETGQIEAIGAWVLEQACVQAVSFARACGRDVGMAVNLSVRQVISPGLAKTVAGILDRTGLSAHLLTLEVTETFLLQDHDRTLATLDELRATGIRIALDDFGTGYSSLSHLRQIRVNIVKIDRLFMSNLADRESEDHAIVSGVIALAHAMRLSVVAEGIETAEQASALRDLGADQGQGYLFSPAVPGAEAVALLAGPGSAEACLAHEDVNL